MNRFTSNFRSFPSTFWAANTLELFERLAYYGIFNLLALYLTNSPETGALGFTQIQKGMIMGIVNAILYFLPVLTGAIADKFGYKKVLIIAFLILSTGYYAMGQVSQFPFVFASFFYVAIGAALFKPIISATIARTTNPSNSSLGFGIFYMLVNIGGLIGPLLASELREISWNYVFIMSSGSILVNLIIVLIFYREPERQINTEPLLKSFATAFLNIFAVLKDLRFVVFLLIISAGWTVYWQYFYSLPVFMEQWVNTAPLYNAIYSISPAIAHAIGTEGGIILTEKIIAMDALFIVLFQVLVSSLIMKIRPLQTMTFGILINAIGLSLSVLTRNPFFTIFSIFIFSIGEMAFSPKILEYIGRIAPGEKAALYMGTQFLPVALGNFIGGFIAGGVYEKLADKYAMIQKMLPQLSGSSNLSNDQLFAAAKNILNTDDAGLNKILWDTYHPNHFGLVLIAFGLSAFIMLYIYDRVLFRQKPES
ncbi:MAG: MFS transporter [Bacteroidales bacterium]|nr:MFS transporter [Bacteroidales bacterium]MCB8999915.1 MFS transporter [Bacteroidales bacterium]